MRESDRFFGLRTQHQRYHLLSAATLNNSRNRNFVHQKDHLRLAAAGLLGHVFACLLWIVVILLLWAWGEPFFRAFVPAAKASYRELMKRGSRACSPSSKPRSWDRR